MKAVICREFGPVSDLEYADMPDPALAPTMNDDGVIISVKAAGVNFPDGLLVQGLYQAKPQTPFSPGMEVAGTIEKTGPSAGSLKPGDRVAAILSHGGYAEKVTTPASSVFPLPDTMPYGDACALLCAWSTAHHALKQRARIAPGETLVVLGAAGSTGLGAIQIGKAMGAQVIAVASSEDKRNASIEAGADEAIGYDNLKDAIRQATGGKGADVIFDPVGGEAFDAACRSMARNGRYLVIGFAAGEIPKFPVNLALLKEFSLVGVFWGAFTRHEPEDFAENIRQLFDWHTRGLVRPVIERNWALCDAAKALEHVLNRRAVGKSILIP